MGRPIPPSTASVIVGGDGYLSFPAVARAGGRLAVIFRTAAGNPLDYDARILITHSDDDGATWSSPAVWVDAPDCDSRNCGGGTLSDGTAHFVYDLHHRDGWRRPFVRFSDDGRCWTEPLHLDAHRPGAGEVQVTSVANRAVEWPDADTLYFPCFRGASVLLDRRRGVQSQRPRVPRHEPAVARNRRGELVAFSKGGVIDVSADDGRSWVAAADVDCISQPDLLTLHDGSLLLCYSGKMRRDEWLLRCDDGHDVYEQAPSALKVFEGDPACELDARGKAMALQHHEEILTVLYEAAAGVGRIYLVRTPTAALAEL